MEAKTIAVVAIILALLACVFGGYAISSEEKGPVGETGLTGETGDIGPQGPIGDKGEQGPQGEQGEQGISGEQGPRGPRGYAGRDGEDGKDLEPNNAPSIYVDDSNSYVEGGSWYDDYRYILNITSSDTENDYRHINVYYNQCGSWNLLMCIPYLLDDEYIIIDKEISGNGICGNHTFNWLIECYDGENLVYLEGNTILYKSCAQ